MKVNLKLLVVILSLEILYFFVMFFIMLFSLFMYFGSGAGSVSQTAITSGKIANLIIISPPILFNLIKIKKFYSSQNKIMFNSYILATFLYCIFIFFMIKNKFLGS
jgi:hypothetical protein